MSGGMLGWTAGLFARRAIEVGDRVEFGDGTIGEVIRAPYAIFGPSWAAVVRTRRGDRFVAISNLRRINSTPSAGRVAEEPPEVDARASDEAARPAHC
jgi:hypothetical protein